MATLLAVSAIVFLAAAGQTVAGFGFGLIAVPPLALLLDPRSAIVVAGLIGLVLSLTTAAGWLLAACAAGLPVGVLVLRAAPERALTALIGICVLGCTWLVWRGVRVREPGRPALAAIGDVFNLIYDRATLAVAWEKVAGNKGAMTAGVDKMTRLHVETVIGVEPFLEELRSSLKDGSFTPLPVRQTTIPKRNGKVRALGIPTLRDRVAQMAVKLILEPIFEVDAYPSSYGYRPGRRAQDAIAEIHHFTTAGYEWVVEGPPCLGDPTP